MEEKGKEEEESEAVVEGADHRRGMEITGPAARPAALGSCVTAIP